MVTSVGVIGAGVISRQYLENLLQFPDLRVDFVADTLVDRAQQVAQEFGIPHAGSVAELMASEVEIVINLTIPAAHSEVTRRALHSGKHVWVEKPLALSTADSEEVLDLAASVNRQVAVAPDTVLGTGVQGFIREVLHGDWGKPMAARAIFATPGPGQWHPAPEPLYAVLGGGPLFDMGPYYLTTLVHLFGPVGSVVAHGSRAQNSKVIGAGPRQGQAFDVTAFTTVSALIKFRSGATAQLFLTFDAGYKKSGIEVHCEKATIEGPDPNRFDGCTSIYPSDRSEPIEKQASHDGLTRGIGVLEMARAIAKGQEPRAHGLLAHHVTEALEAIQTSMTGAGASTDVFSLVPRIELMDENWNPLVGSSSRAEESS